MSVEERVFKVISKVCKVDVEKISRDSSYVNDFNIQKSVAYMQLAMMLEEEFDVDVEFYKIKNSGTVGATVDYIQSLIK